MSVIRGARWWTAANGLVGAVLTYDEVTGSVRAFIGPAAGHDEALDAAHLADWGAPPAVGMAMFPAYAEREWRA